MPATGRSCRQSVRHFVRLSDPRRRRRRLLSPDARGPPSAARSSRGPARRRAPPPPGPALPCLPVCPSVRPPALPSFCRAAGPPACVPAAPALSLPSSLSLCLCPRALGPSLAPGSRVPFPSAPLLSHSHGFWHPHSSGHLLRSFGGLSFRTRSTPPGLLSLPHIRRGSSLIPLLLILGGCPPPTPYFPRGFPLLRGLQYLCQNLLHPLAVSLNLQYLPSSLTSELLCLTKFVRCGCHCLSLFS